VPENSTVPTTADMIYLNGFCLSDESQSKFLESGPFGIIWPNQQLLLNLLLW